MRSHHMCPVCQRRWSHGQCIVKDLEVTKCPDHCGADKQLLFYRRNIADNWEYEDDFLQFVTEVRDGREHS